MRPPFPRQGNKYALRNSIIPNFPEHKIYVEPFVGSAAIFFNKEKADINVLNDLDKELINRLKLLKKAPIDKSLYKNDLNTIEKIKNFYDNHSNSITDLILYNKIITSNGFNNQPALKSSKIYKDVNPYSIVPKIEEYQNKLENVKLLSRDYEKIIKQYDSPDTLFFLDPPYENSKITLGYAEDKNFDFEKFAKIVKNIKGKFFLTINDSKYIRELFKEFKQNNISVYTTWANANENINKYRKELFITNY
jgi:DNA adenine methylase